VSRLAQFGVAADRASSAGQPELDPTELESLAAWATGRLRPDVSVLLDRAPVAAAPQVGGVAGEEHVRVQRLLTRMAAAEPHRYVVVDPDGPSDEVVERIFSGLQPVLPKPPARGADAAVTR
jgi:dTMP kinase